MNPPPTLNRLLILFDRLFAHEDDPDIDEPYEAPKGVTLGKQGTHTV